MTKRNLKLAFAVAVIAAAGACGGNNETNNDATNNDATNNDTSNNTSTNNDTSNNNTSTNNDTTPTNNASNNNTTPTNNNTVPPIEEPPGCDDAERPPRCDEDPATFAYGPASVMTELIVQGTAEDPVCCFDYTGDGNIDNALGVGIAGFQQLEGINASIKGNIEDGSLDLVLEPDGLEALDNDDAFTTNFYVGAHDGEFTTFAPSANPVLINPASFDEGAQPQAYLPGASVTGGALVAGPGSVEIQVVLFDAPLSLTISQARIEADVDAANSALDATGVSLASGKLGGVVKKSDIFNAFNNLAASPACTCLGLGADPLVNLETAACNANADTAACETEGQTACVEVVGACDYLAAIDLLTDVDLDGDGTADSVSIGLAYSASGAEITGVAAAQ